MSDNGGGCDCIRESILSTLLLWFCSSTQLNWIFLFSCNLWVSLWSLKRNIKKNSATRLEWGNNCRHSCAFVAIKTDVEPTNEELFSAASIDGRCVCYRNLISIVFPYFFSFFFSISAVLLHAFISLTTGQLSISSAFDRIIYLVVTVTFSHTFSPFVVDLNRLLLSPHKKHLSIIEWIAANNHKLPTVETLFIAYTLRVQCAMNARSLVVDFFSIIIIIVAMAI